MRRRSTTFRAEFAEKWHSALARAGRFSFFGGREVFSPRGVPGTEVHLRGNDAGDQNDQLLLLLRSLEPAGREPVDLSAQGAQAGPQLIPLRLLLRLLRFHGGSFNEAPLIVATARASRKRHSRVSVSVPRSRV